MAEGWNGVEWARLPAPPLPGGATGGKLVGVSCYATACVAVGESHEAAAGSEKALAVRWNGSSWSSLSIPSPSGAEGFVNATGVSCLSSGVCTAAGYYASAVSGGVPTEMRTLAEFWNGTEWTIQTTANPAATTNAFVGVSCTATSACTAVGLSSEEYFGKRPAPLVERWNGTSWSTQSAPFPEPPPPDAELKSVSCAGSTCIGIGKDDASKNSFLERWTGSEWKLMQSVSGEINKVSCASATACVAVGLSSTGVAQTWMIYEYLGGWVVSPQPPPLPGGATETTLKGVSCTATACTAVGSYKSGSTYKPLIERWNGSSWSLQTAPGPAEGSAQNGMLAVSCASFRAANTCLAVGEAAGKPVAEIWNGSEWSRTSAPPLPGGATGAKFVGISCGSPTSCMAVGSSYEAAAGSEKALIERWNGSSWSILTSPTPAEAKGFINLYDISCLSPNSCFAAGTYASSVTGGAPLATRTLAETWENGVWTLQSSPNASGQAYNALLGVSCTSSISCNALGGSTPTLTGASTLLAERYE